MYLVVVVRLLEHDRCGEFDKPVAALSKAIGACLEGVPFLQEFGLLVLGELNCSIGQRLLHVKFLDCMKGR